MPPRKEVPKTGSEGTAPSKVDRPKLSGELQSIKDIFGDLYEPYITNTEQDVISYMRKFSREDTPPPATNEWEVRIGLSKFIVPPLNIDVNQSFRAGAIGSAIRQQSSPKFNSGHSETMISMTLYFPTHESIWGFDGDKLEIDFEKAPDRVIDKLASSLRGLVAQFKYAPFLPIKSAYINGVYGITGVTMHSMTVNTVPGFPFCLAVNLNMLSFNHKVYLPMVEDFDNAIHWGRFRQYVGRASHKLAEVASKGFLNAITQDDYDALINQQNQDSLLARFRDLLPEYFKKERLTTFNKISEWSQGKNLEIFYPDHTPVGIVYPDLTNFRDPHASSNDRKRRNWWQGAMDHLGFPYAPDSESSYENASRYNDSQYGDYYLKDENRLLREWLRINKYSAEDMRSDVLDAYIAKRTKELGREPSLNTVLEFQSRLRQSWFALVYESYITDPYLSNVFESQQGQTLIKEWEVPMRRLELDPKKAIVNGVSVSLGNNFARLQLQLQEEPVHQHIGGLDTRCDISLTVMGESELRKLKNLWKHINGLARLEHGHGVLGFLGMKNIVTALCGMKYVMPENMEVKTVPNFPHVYEVNLSFIDFDVFQQKREMLSSDQQAEFIEAFSKKNPFLRIKQRWSAFNAYPDFPLTIRDDEAKIVGNLDPDFYFKSYRTIDKDVTDMSQSWDSNVYQTLMTTPGASTQNDAVIQSITTGGLTVNQDGVTLDGVNDVKKWYEANADKVRFSSHIPGLTPLGNYQNPYKDHGASPTSAFQHILQDARFRDNGGRMIRAFPTYMLWLIDEGGVFSGVKLYDNFYGLQSVIDIGVGLSEDNMADSLIIQISNLYSRLSTPYRNTIDESVYSGANIINTQLNRSRNLASGLTDYLVTLDTVELKPGVRIHLRMGYSANPNALDTVFNGVITNVELGEVVTVTAQSDTIELSAVVNNSNTEGHTGKADGSLWGMWVSEPRDLMIRLLTMGASKTKEATAHATGGRIFSENRWGIRHFGSIIYPTMTLNEKNLHEHKGKAIDDSIKAVMGGDMQDILGGPAGLFNFGVFDVFSSLSSNFFRKRDYEIFKRNIYPGNGTGLSQYQGGDLGDAGLALGLMGSTGVGPNGTIIDPATGQPSYPRSAQEIVGAPPATSGVPTNIVGSVPILDRSNSPYPDIPWINNQPHPFMTSLGLAQQDEDDDVRGADEVSFRASTYMKTVWDLFQLCAALLPNYIVTVRPFEERSTIFYGKPHWLYTSGVIPLTTGLNHDQLGIEDPDEEVLSLLDEARKALKAEKESDKEFYDRLSEASYDPGDSSAGVGQTGTSSGEDIDFFMAAISSQESGGDPNVVNKGSGAHGQFQIMPANWKPWAKEAGLGDNPPKTQANQNIVARFKMLQYYRQYGSWEAVAIAWFAGPGRAQKYVNGDMSVLNLSDGGATVKQYIDKMNAGMAAARGGSIPPATTGVPAPSIAKGVIPDSLATVDILAQMKLKNIDDPLTFAHLWGWGLDKFPIDYTDPERGILDEVGVRAKEVYSGTVSDSDAQTIWNEFRMDFRGEGGHAKKAFGRLFPNQPDKVFNQVVDEFIKFMWQNAYHRGWLVKTVDAEFTIGSAITGDAAQIANFLGRVPGLGITANTISDGLGALGSVLNAGAGIISNPLGSVAKIPGVGGDNSGNHYDFHNARKVFEIWLMDPSGAKDFMIENADPGKKQGGLFGRATEEFYTRVWSGFTDLLGNITGAITSAATGILSLFRFSMLGLGSGISQATFNQQISNMMNRAFNDSIYFQAGPPGTLAFLADNPFTREYGEPVIEVRQPLQRVHILNSFRNIISNNIQENTEGVANVVTATSGGEHAVTVHLDKGIPAEKQVERTVETGLIWDQGGPSGGIPIVRNVLHPVETLRGWADHFNNGKEETSAKRVALWHLKEGIKDIYGGEITILGDASIRPYDLIYVGDVYERMYGLCEVEQVVHHFNAEMGFITSITPNALVSVNDPARWSMMSYIRARLNTWNLRNDMRNVYGAGRGANVVGRESLPAHMTYDQLARSFEGHLLGSIEFSGGNTALIKDIAAMGFTGQLGAGDIGPNSGSRRGALLGGLNDWAGWNTVREKLLDQQSCYIQYLTKDGRPMDAGIYDNRGIGVGQQRVATLFKNSLRLELPFNNKEGNSRIATNDLLAKLGWSQLQIADLVQELDLETNLIKGQILDLAGRTDDGALGNTEAHYVRVVRVIDADTIKVSPPINGSFDTIRFAGIDSPEVAFKSVGEGTDSEANLQFAEQLAPLDPGVRAWRFTHDRIMGKKIGVRVSKKEPIDLYGRVLGYIFYYNPEDLGEGQELDTVIKEATEGENFVSWDAYRPNGMPYTLNWELVVNGHANVYLYKHEQIIPGQGADGSVIVGGDY